MNSPIDPCPRAAALQGPPPGGAEETSGARAFPRQPANQAVDQAHALDALDAVNADSGASLFAGDTGSLRLETRRVIVQLLLGPALDARRQSRLWPVLVRDEAIVRARLHELFLDLVIDREQEVAFTRQVTSPELELPILLRRTPLTLLDSALLLFLRQRLTESDAQMERAVVSTQEMAEHLSMFQREATTDHARFGKQVQHAIDNAVKYSLLRKLRNSDERFEVAPTLKLLFSAEEILALGRSYRVQGGAANIYTGASAEADEATGTAGFEAEEDDA